MIDLESLLLVVAANPSRPTESRFLLCRRPDGRLSLPGENPDGGTCLSTAASLLCRHTGLKPDSFGVKIALLDFADDEKRRSTFSTDRAASVTHGCLIPEVVPVNNPLEWRTLSEVMAARPLFGDHLDILLRASRKLGRSF